VLRIPVRIESYLALTRLLARTPLSLNLSSLLWILGVAAPVRWCHLVLGEIHQPLVVSAKAGSAGATTKKNSPMAGKCKAVHNNIITPFPQSSSLWQVLNPSESSLKWPESSERITPL
jgi:hypothetical protein